MADSAVHDVYRKSNFIADDLRAKIVDGTYQPGDRLPSRTELVARYAVSKVTVQRAYEQLQRDGFAISKVGSGTIVAPNSPHLTRYAMLFPHREQAAGRNRFWYALAQEAQRLKGGQEVELHYGFDGSQGVERYQGLLADVANSRLAGIIFTSAPFQLKNSPLLDQPGIPRAAFMSKSQTMDLPTVTVDGADLRRQIAEQALASGATRFALIAPDQYSMAEIAAVTADFEDHGLHFNPDWVHGASNVHPEWVMPLLRLLMAGPANQRPDGLIVLDDNLLPALSQELRRLEIIPPRDVQLISHCNFPWPTPSAVPATRIGYCVHECLTALMQKIDAQQQGADFERHTILPAYHQDTYPRMIHDQE